MSSVDLVCSLCEQMSCKEIFFFEKTAKSWIVYNTQKLLLNLVRCYKSIVVIFEDVHKFKCSVGVKWQDAGDLLTTMMSECACLHVMGVAGGSYFQYEGWDKVQLEGGAAEPSTPSSPRADLSIPFPWIDQFFRNIKGLPWWLRQ